MKFLNSALVTLIGFALANAETASRGRDAQSAPRGRVLPGYGDGGEYGGKKGGYGSESAEGYGGKKAGYGSESADGADYGGKKAGYDAEGADYGGKKVGYVPGGGKKAGYDFDGYGGKKGGYDADDYGGKKGCGKGKGGKGKGGGYGDGYGGKKAGYEAGDYGGKKAGYDFDGYGGKKGGYDDDCDPEPECIAAEFMCVDGAPTVAIEYSYTDDCNTPDADPHGCAPMPSDFVGLYPCEEEIDGFKNEPATWVYTCYDRNCRRDDIDTATSEGSFTMADDTLPAFSTQGRHMSLEAITETQPGCYIAALNRLDGFSPPPYYNICLSSEIEITPC